jgi:hypothetical protein
VQIYKKTAASHTFENEKANENAMRIFVRVLATQHRSITGLKHLTLKHLPMFWNLLFVSSFDLQKNA